MAKSICSGYAFNSGVSPCQFEPGKIKGLILIPTIYDKSDLFIDADTRWWENSVVFEDLIYRDRPVRIYPIGGIVNYESSGGEVQTSQTGYGSSRITGYSEKQMTFTLDGRDNDLCAQIVSNRGRGFSVYFVDDENRIYGSTFNVAEDYARGFELAGIAVGGQDFATADVPAALSLTLYIKDYEAMLKSMQVYVPGFDVLSLCEGLVWVDANFQNSGTETLVFIRTHNGGVNISAEVFGSLTTSNVGTVFTHTGSSTVSSIAYNAEADAIVITHAAAGNTYTGLAAPSVLKAQGVLGIEQY